MNQQDFVYRDPFYNADNIPLATAGDFIAFATYLIKLLVVNGFIENEDRFWDSFSFALERSEKLKGEVKIMEYNLCVI